jgi:GNAT superfamily N-acetyltransferase
MSHEANCHQCGAMIAGPDMTAFGDAFIAHARSAHPDWPYPDVAIRNYAEATQRLTGPTARLEQLREVEIAVVTEEHLDDWLAFFDHDAFVDNPAWASCYCVEPHLRQPGAGADATAAMSWRESREAMVRLLRSGESFGYLAYVDGRPAGWVNASRRSAYGLYRLGRGANPSDDHVIGISCFIIAPPYRRHALAGRLLDRVLADAPGRGARYLEAYPSTNTPDSDAANFRGPRSLFEGRQFLPVEEREHYTVMRRPVS